MNRTAAVLRVPLLAAGVLIFTTSATSAQPPASDRAFDSRLAGIRAPRHIERAPQAMLLARRQQASQPKRSWIKRHPVLFGAIAGSVTGASLVGVTVDAEASPVGFYGGGAVGALVGWVVSR